MFDNRHTGEILEGSRGKGVLDSMILIYEMSTLVLVEGMQPKEWRQHKTKAIRYPSSARPNGSLDHIFVGCCNEYQRQAEVRL